MRDYQYSRIIFHIDVNSAFLSWSAVKRLQEDPGCVDLRTIPSVVGGDASTRHGIVTAKSVPAKKYGIRTADTVASAMRRCPGLVVVPSDFATYREYSHRFLDILREYTTEVEQASIDEAYLDATALCVPENRDRFLLEPPGTRTPGMRDRGCRVPGIQDVESRDRDPWLSRSPQCETAVLLAAQIRQQIRERLGFTVNVGISSNRLLAKMASDFEKPDRTHTLFPEEVPEKMWPLPIGDLYGCGRRTAERLRTLGIMTIGDAAHTSQAVLTDHLGDKAGKYIYNAANGNGSASVFPVREDAKSYSNEWTTSSDIREETYEAEFLPLLQHLCDKVAGRLKRDGVYGRTVVVTVKTDDFRRRSAQRRLADPSNEPEILYQTAASLADKLLLGDRGLFADGAGIRLVGAGATDLDDGTFRQVNLFDWMREDADGSAPAMPVEDRPTPSMPASKVESEAETKAAARAERVRDNAQEDQSAPAKPSMPALEAEDEPASAMPAESESGTEAAARAERLREMEALINRRYGEGTVRKGTGSSEPIETAHH